MRKFTQRIYIYGLSFELSARYPRNISAVAYRTNTLSTKTYITLGQFGEALSALQEMGDWENIDDILNSNGTNMTRKII
ncbi:hypothetical protein AFL46_15670 [Providencia stuartii]|nr:hypothetical protein AFL46_15670 [Providencia stuartii]